MANDKYKVGDRVAVRTYEINGPVLTWPSLIEAQVMQVAEEGSAVLLRSIKRTIFGRRPTAWVGRDYVVGLVIARCPDGTPLTENSTK